MRGDEYRSNHPDFAHEISVGKKRAFTLLAQLQGATGRDRRRLLMRRLLHGEAASLLYYAYEGVRRAKELGEHSPDVIRAMAADLNVHEPLIEPIDVLVRHKRGRDREVYSFRPQSRARQLLVADVLRAIHPSRPNQFMEKGGVSAALRAVEQAVRDGHVYAREVDIQNFYPSVRLEQLIEALRPLPRAVVEGTVWLPGGTPLRRAHASLSDDFSAGLQTRETGELSL